MLCRLGADPPRTYVDELDLQLDFSCKPVARLVSAGGAPAARAETTPLQHALQLSTLPFTGRSDRFRQFPPPPG
eukprot:COSAG03_NODE_1262_length_4446_cov_82.855533_6_plen_74_part_00